MSFWGISLTVLNSMIKQSFMRFLSVRVKASTTPNPLTVMFEAEPNVDRFTRPIPFDRANILSAKLPRKVDSIFSIPGVERVLLFSPFSAAITVASESFSDSEFMKRAEQILSAEEEDYKGYSESSTILGASDSNPEIVSAIEEVLAIRLRPSIQADGGDVELVGYCAKTKTVSVRMQGACVGCPSSEQTLKDGITRTLRHYLPNDVETVDCAQVVKDPVIRHAHDGVPIQREELNGIPWVSLFAMKAVDDKMKRQVHFVSHLNVKESAISEETVVAISCKTCGGKKAIEGLDSLLLQQPMATKEACVVVCPACAVHLKAV